MSVVTRVVCARCGNTKPEARWQGAFLHQHEWIKWTGEEYEVSAR